MKDELDELIEQEEYLNMDGGEEEEKETRGCHDSLNELVSHVIDRIYYGTECDKPNNHCKWFEGFGIDREDGWYETDEHMRERLKSLLG